VRRLSLLDPITHAVLFDCAPRWTGDPAVESVSALVRSFFQFAGELGESDVLRVKFSAGDLPRQNRHNRSRSRTGPILNGARKSQTQDDMYLVCAKGTSALLALFVSFKPDSPEQDQVDALLQELDSIHGSLGDDASKLRTATLAAIEKHFPDRQSPSAQALTLA